MERDNATVCGDVAEAELAAEAQEEDV